MDDFTESNKYSRKQIFHLRHVELEPIKSNSKELKIPDSKSVVSNLVFHVIWPFRSRRLTIHSLSSKLTYIVETRNLELIAHPVIAKLIQVKWNDFGR